MASHWVRACTYCFQFRHVVASRNGSTAANHSTKNWAIVRAISVRPGPGLPRASPPRPLSLWNNHALRWSGICLSPTLFRCLGGGVFASYPFGRPRLSRGGQLAECCGDDVDAASQPAGRKFAGGYEAVSGCATDSQQLRGTGHRQQQREFAKDIVLQFNSPPSRMDMNDAFVALAGCTGGRTWLLRHRDRDGARSFVFAFAAPRDWRAGVRRLGEKVQDNVVVGDPISDSVAQSSAFQLMFAVWSKTSRGRPRCDALSYAAPLLSR